MRSWSILLVGTLCIFCLMFVYNVSLCAFSWRDIIFRRFHADLILKSKSVQISVLVLFNSTQECLGEGGIGASVFSAAACRPLIITTQIDYVYRILV